MTKEKEKGRVVKKGVKVTAVGTTGGRAATTVHVEVEPDQLAEELEGMKDVQGVVADIPQAKDGGVEWKEEPLGKIDSRIKEGTRPSIVERFAETHYGPTEARRLGVAVRVKTDKGTVMPNEEGETFSISDPDKPPRPEKIRPQK